MLEEQDRHRNDDSIERQAPSKTNLVVEHRKLTEAYAVLQEKIARLEKNKMLETFGAERGRASPTSHKRLSEELKEKDRRNIELQKELKELAEHNQQLREENDKRSRQLAGKIAELKREHERYEQLLNRLKQQETVSETQQTS